MLASVSIFSLHFDSQFSYFSYAKLLRLCLFITTKPFSFSSASVSTRSSGQSAHPPPPRPLLHLPCLTSTQSPGTPGARPGRLLPHQPLGEAQNAGVRPPAEADPGPDQSRPLEAGLPLPDTELVTGQQLRQPLGLGGWQRRVDEAQPDGHGRGGSEFGPNGPSVWTAAGRRSVRATVLLEMKQRLCAFFFKE